MVLPQGSVIRNETQDVLARVASACISIDSWLAGTDVQPMRRP